MKKFIFLVTFLVATFFSFGQVNYKAIAVSESDKSNSTWEELVTVQYPVLIVDNSVTIYGDKMMIYIVTQSEEVMIEGAVVIIMTAIDNKNKECELWFVQGERSLNLLVFYGHKSIGYLLVRL